MSATLSNDVERLRQVPEREDKMPDSAAQTSVSTDNEVLVVQFFWHFTRLRFRYSQTVPRVAWAPCRGAELSVYGRTHVSAAAEEEKVNRMKCNTIFVIFCIFMALKAFHLLHFQSSAYKGFPCLNHTPR